MESITTMDTINVSVSLFEPQIMESGKVPSPESWGNPKNQYDSWMAVKEINLKTLKQFTLHVVKSYIDKMDDWNPNTPKNEDFVALYDGVDGSWGGKVDKLEFLNIYRDPYVENSYTCEVTYKGSNVILAIVRFDFDIRKSLDKIFEKEIIE